MSRGTVVALVAVAFAAGFGVLVVTWKDHEPASVPDRASTAALEDLAASVRALTDRLVALERRIAAPRGAGVDRVSGDRVDERPRPGVASSDDLLGKRVAWVEAEVQRLSKGENGSGSVPDDLVALKRAMKDKNLHGHDVEPEQVRRRMALDRRFLELGPLDPRAKEVLGRLVSDLVLRIRDADAARALVREVGPTMRLKAWEMDLRLASIEGMLGHHGDKRAILRRVLATPDLPLRERVSAEFWVGYTFQREGRFSEARAAYEALIAAHGVNTPPMLQSSVGGARAQLEQIAEWEKRK